MTQFNIDRRTLLAGASALANSAAFPRLALAQGAPIRVGVLTSLTGSLAIYGNLIAKAVKGVVDETNAGGGVAGRKIELTIEDDQTNPEPAVRAARKLIDVDKVCAILGTAASSVTTAVAPLCWESKTFLTNTSSADSITLLPHQGYLIRTQPNTTLQGKKFGEFCVAEKAKRVFYVSPQTPFARSQFDNVTAVVKAAGGDSAILIYDDKKPAYRSEVDDILRFNPDAIIFGGYTPDTAVMLKDLYRADYKGKKIAFGFSVNQKLLDSVPPEVVENTFAISPSPVEDSSAYQRLTKLVGVASPDPYTCQVYDHINLILMTIALSGEATGTSIKDNIRKVSQAPGGAKVDNLADGLKLIAAKQAVDYEGASGNCDLNEIGDITDCKFRYDQVKAGKFVFVKIA